MNTRWIQLQRHSLSAIAMLMIVSLMSPTGAVAAPKCDTPPCGGGGGGGGKSSDLYTVDVYFQSFSQEPDAKYFVGGATNVDGSGNKKRQKIGDASMNLGLTRMSTMLGDACSEEFGSVDEIDGEFAIGTARLSKSGDLLTYVTASFWNFTVNGSAYFLVFGPDGDASIADSENWHPANSGDVNFVYGTSLELQVVSGPAKNGPCDKLNISLAWNIRVTNVTKE